MLRTMPAATRPEPNGPSMVEVRVARLPALSAADMWLVAGTSARRCALRGAMPLGAPGGASSMARSRRIRAERAAI